MEGHTDSLAAAQAACGARVCVPSVDCVHRFQSGMQQGAHPFNDFFSDFFGGGFGGGARETPKAQPSTMRLNVSLEQLYKGETLDVSFTRPVLCMHAEECFTKKPDCKGPGIRVITQQMGPGFIVQNQIQDDSCVDQGKAWRPRCKVSVCSLSFTRFLQSPNRLSVLEWCSPVFSCPQECPKGIVQPETIELSATVERGMRHGDQIVFDGVGEHKVGHEPGDLILTINELPHKRYALRLWFRLGDLFLLMFSFDTETRVYTRRVPEQVQTRR